MPKVTKKISFRSDSLATARRFACKSLMSNGQRLSARELALLESAATIAALRQCITERSPHVGEKPKALKPGRKSAAKYIATF